MDGQTESVRVVSGLASTLCCLPSPVLLLVNARDCIDLEGGVMLGFVWFAALGCIAFIAIRCCSLLAWQLRSIRACIWVELLASAANSVSYELHIMG